MADQKKSFKTGDQLTLKAKGGAALFQVMGVGRATHGDIYHVSRVGADGKPSGHESDQMLVNQSDVQDADAAQAKSAKTPVKGVRQDDKAQQAAKEGMGERAVQTSNPDWGFHGTYKTAHGASDEEAGRAYADAHAQVMKHFKMNHGEAQAFLDSRHGRHMADQVSKGKASEHSAEYLRKHGDSVLKAWRKHGGALMTAKREAYEDDTFKEVGHFPHPAEKPKDYMPLYRNKKTGEYHHEGENGDGPSSQGYKSPEAALGGLRKAVAPFLQREGDMSARDAEAHAARYQVRLHTKAESILVRVEADEAKKYHKVGDRFQMDWDGPSHVEVVDRELKDGDAHYTVQRVRKDDQAGGHEMTVKHSELEKERAKSEAAGYGEQDKAPTASRSSGLFRSGGGWEGSTKSGKKVRAEGNRRTHDWSAQDHKDAALMHDRYAKQYAKTSAGNMGQRKMQAHHAAQVEYHRAQAQRLEKGQ
jgi:hypothetical protein